MIEDADPHDIGTEDGSLEMLGFALMGLAGVVSLLALAAFLYFVR